MSVIHKNKRPAMRDTAPLLQIKPDQSKTTNIYLYFRVLNLYETQNIIREWVNYQSRFEPYIKKIIIQPGEHNRFSSTPTKI